MYEQSACASCVPEVVGRNSEGLVVRSPQHQSQLEIKSDVLRGVRTDVVLRRRATLLSSGAGSEATYLLSRLTDHLGAFVSHNWCVSRSKKWLALCVHFNLWPALFCGAMIALLLCVATSLGWLPLAAIEHDYWEYEGLYCNVCGFLVFQVVLFFLAQTSRLHAVGRNLPTRSASTRLISCCSGRASSLWAASYITRGAWSCFTHRCIPRNSGRCTRWRFS